MDKAPQDWREFRRLRALDLHERGWRGAKIADALGVSKGAVSQWLSKAAEHGREALRTKKAPGATPKLTPEQFDELVELLEQGAERQGFQGDVWSCPRVVEIVKRKFGVTYSTAHMSRILKKLGWSPQKPVRRATQRDEQAIEAWREERWPEVKKAPSSRAEP